MKFTIPDDKITHTFKTLSPRQARQLMTDTTYAKQRKLDDSYVDEYGLIMARGEWRPASDIALASHKGRLHRINGSHTLEAIARGTLSQRVSILTYECQEEWEIYALYLTYDRNRLRSLDQLYEAFGFGEQHELNKEQTRHLGAAMLPLAAGFAAVPAGRVPFRALLHSGPIRLGMMQSWVKEAHAYYDTIKGCPAPMSKPLRRSIVLAMALVTFRRDAEENDHKAHTFWTNVAWDDRLTSNDPQKSLHKWLRENPLTHYEPHTYARSIAMAWNAAWHKQTRVTLTGDKNPALLLEGTPHKGEIVMSYLSRGGEPLKEPQLLPVQG